jgi:hypothetical protein
MTLGHLLLPSFAPESEDFSSSRMIILEHEVVGGM